MVLGFDRRLREAERGLHVVRTLPDRETTHGTEPGPAGEGLQTRQVDDLGSSLAQALRYVRAWKSKTVVVKYGGSVMASGPSPSDGDTVIEDLVALKGAGVDPVLVHGGGPEITRMLERLGKTSRFINGLRITDGETMDVVEMVLAGRTNKHLVSVITAAGGAAVGISGQDGRVFQARKLRGPDDLGQVGEVDAVDPTVVTLLSANGFVPVIASIGIGSDGQSYNLNADHAAGALAAALGASKFIVLTDVPGVLAGPGEDRPVSTLRSEQARRLISDGVISQGMIPKVEACLAALSAGVRSAHIISARQPHALLVELFTEEGVGTMLTP